MRSRRAASSIASGMPSSRRHRSTSLGSVPGVTANPGTAAARSASRLTASPPPSPSATPSGPILKTTSPGRSSGWRPVTSSTGSAAPCTIVSARAAQASTTCSQVSRMSSARLPRSVAASQPGDGPPLAPGSIRSPSADATARSIPSASRSADRSARNTPSGNVRATSPATLTASRVLPAPPGPVSVTSLDRASASLIAVASCARPKKRVRWPGGQSSPVRHQSCSTLSPRQRQ